MDARFVIGTRRILTSERVIWLVGYAATKRHAHVRYFTDDGNAEHPTSKIARRSYASDSNGIA